MYKIFTNLFLLISVVIVFVLFAIKLTFEDASFGDGAIFADTHYFMFNGSFLYNDVWDHKDYGYFLIGTPFYSLFGIYGLFILGLISILSCCLSIWYCAKIYTTNFISILLSLISIIFYASSFGFSPLQPEFLSINFLITGATLILFGRISGGILLALSVMIKIGSILPVILFFLSFYIICNFNSQNIIIKKIYKSLATFSFTIATVVVISILNNALTGWIEIINFNIFYSNYVRNGHSFDPTDAASFLLANIRVLYGIYAYAGKSIIIACFLNICLLLSTIWFLKNFPKYSIKKFLITFIPHYGILLGCYLTMLTQAPPANHHYIYILVPLMVTSSIIAANLMCLINQNAQRYLSILLSLFIFIYLISSAYQKGFKAWVDPYDNAQIEYELGVLKEDKTFAILRGNHDLLAGSIKTNAKLKCRHFYQLEHIIIYYQDEILSCIKSKPDVIFVNENEIKGLWKSQVNFYVERISPFIQRNYKNCFSINKNFKIFVRLDQTCPIKK